MTSFLKKFKLWAIAVMVLLFFAAVPLSSCTSQGQSEAQTESEEHPEGEEEEHPEEEEEGEEQE